MENILNKITELLHIIEQKEKLIRREEELLKPLMTDFSNVRLVHEIYTGIEKKSYGKTQDVNEEKKLFIFIVGLLYAPRIIFDIRLPRNLRPYISEVINKNGSFISNSISQVRFRYMYTTEYQKEINYLYDKVLYKLIDIGKLQIL